MLGNFPYFLHSAAFETPSRWLPELALCLWSIGTQLQSVGCLWRPLKYVFVRLYDKIPGKISVTPDADGKAAHHDGSSRQRKLFTWFVWEPENKRGCDPKYPCWGHDLRGLSFASPSLTVPLSFNSTRVGLFDTWFSGRTQDPKCRGLLFNFAPSTDRANILLTSVQNRRGHTLTPCTDSSMSWQKKK